MRRILLYSLLCIGFLLVPAAARAQAPFGRPYSNPYAPPAYSPYLNLLRRDANPAVNYYGLVRPEIETRGRIRQLQTEINNIAPYTTGTEDASGLPFTGHPTQFQNLTHFYPGSGLSGPTVRRGSSPAQQTAGKPPQQQQGGRPARGR